MELIEIAQLVTGIATLIVATVLIWQMIIQKRTLAIAHNDADSNMSLQAMESRSEQQRWFADNCNQEMIEKMKKGYEYLNDVEKQIAEAHFQNVTQMIATEYRLGRLAQNSDYTRHNFKNKVMMDEFKAMRDIFRELYIEAEKINFSLISKKFLDTGKEVWEEASGKKFE
jgi:hypothetical protein|tara:strand:- start:733 stop:1242 length:510 start_codon:yes stop_codon:yes gene_type:complete